MPGDDLLSIGAFSVMSGLSIPTLRHYDGVALLKPAEVDEASGYRRYLPSQLRRARMIRALRSIDIPIDRIRDVLAADGVEIAEGVLIGHRDQLLSRQAETGRMLRRVNEYIERGVDTAMTTTCRIVEINIGAADLESSRRFYEDAFGLEFEQERHGDGPEHIHASFGTWPSEQFFLLNISHARRHPDRAGKANFGLLVDDLDRVHKAALAVGASEVLAPSDVPGMPRTSTVDDPDGNRINLYQDA